MSVYIKHFLLNIGEMIQCAYHEIVPPQVDHSKEDLEHIASLGYVESFAKGIRN